MRRSVIFNLFSTAFAQLRLRRKKGRDIEKMDGPTFPLVCARCKVTSSLMWEKNKEGEILCLECHSNSRQEPASVLSRSERPMTTAASSHSNREPVVATASSEPPSTSAGFTGRRTRQRNAKGRYGRAPAVENATKNSATPPSSASPAPMGGSQSPAPPPAPPSSSQQQTESNTTSSQKKGKTSSGRRSLIRVTKPTKAPAFDATVVTSDAVLHKVRSTYQKGKQRKISANVLFILPIFHTQGTRYEVGDIVSIMDENGRVYYALLRGFLEDQYAEKYAALTWLIPTTPNPKDFDPSLFVLGIHHTH